VTGSQSALPLRRSPAVIPTARPEASSPAVHALNGAIERLESVVHLETAGLMRRESLDLRDYSARKSQGLLELGRSMRAIEGRALEPGTAARLRSLRAALERNRVVLKNHLDAVQEISAMVAGTMRDAESDGTYTTAIRPMRPA
jgi:hypothetical protein